MDISQFRMEAVAGPRTVIDRVARAAALPMKWWQPAGISIVG